MVIALGYWNSNPVYTLVNNNCAKFAHYLANLIADQRGTAVVRHVRRHYAAKISVLQRSSIKRARSSMRMWPHRASSLCSNAGQNTEAGLLGWVGSNGAVYGIDIN